MVQFWTLWRIPKKLQVGDRVYYIFNKRHLSVVCLFAGQFPLLENTDMGGIIVGK
jgi:hypothetical protein